MTPILFCDSPLVILHEQVFRDERFRHAGDPEPKLVDAWIRKRHSPQQIRTAVDEPIRCQVQQKRTVAGYFMLVHHFSRFIIH